MKRNLVVSALAVCLIFAACAQQPTADDVVNKMVQSLGGAEKVASIQDQVSTWDYNMTMKMGDSSIAETGAMTITYKRPNKIKFEMKNPNGEVGSLSVFDGTNGWIYMIGPASPSWRDMSPPEIQETTSLAETWVDGWHGYAAKGFKLAMLSDTTMDGKSYHRLQATDRFGNVSMNYCDTQTGLCARMEANITDMMTMQKTANVMTFADYAMHDGLMVAGKFMQRDVQGMMSFEANLKEAKHNTGVADDTFTKPAPPATEQPTEPSAANK